MADSEWSDLGLHYIHWSLSVSSICVKYDRNMIGLDP